MLRVVVAGLVGSGHILVVFAGLIIIAAVLVVRQSEEQEG
jgi:hypothetical protein